MNSWSIYWDRRVISIALLGVCCGLPWSLTHSTLTYWLAREGVSMKVVGLFALASIPYTLKFLWAPLFDRYVVPHFGRFGQKQGWMIASQLGLAMCLGAMSQVDPHRALSYLGLLTVLTSFFAASQDIAVDGWRVEALEDDEQGVGASVATLGYRVGMYISSAGAILLSAYASWSVIYLSLALLCLAGVGVSFWSHSTSALEDSNVEALPRLAKIGLYATLALPLLFVVGALINDDPTNPLSFIGVSQPAWATFEHALINAKGYTKAVVGGLMFLIVAWVVARQKLTPQSSVELITSDEASESNEASKTSKASESSMGARFLRSNWALVLCFIATFRLGDHLLSFFLYPSLSQLGFDELEIASVAKTWGLMATIGGTLLGGALVYKVGLMRAMIISGVAQLLSNLTLSAQALLGAPENLAWARELLGVSPWLSSTLHGHETLAFLYVSIGAQDLALGMVNATFVAYLSSLCDRRVAASHFAFFTALSSLLKSFVQAGFGEVADTCQASFGLYHGWAAYFAITSLVALPGVCLMLIINRRYSRFR